MKFFAAVFSAIIIIGLALSLSSCSQMAVDPIVPIVDKPDSNIVANKVTFTVECPATSYSLLQGESLTLHAVVAMHKDANAKDSAVRNYVLSDSSLSWSILSGPGTITSSGVYFAPSRIDVGSVDVRIVVRAGVDPSAFKNISIVVRTPNLMPLAAGSYWIRNHYALDTVTSQRLPAQSYTDSTVVSDVLPWFGRQAAMLTSYRNGLAHDTLMLSTELNALYAYRQPLATMGITILPAQWMKIVDAVATPWTVYDTTLANVATMLNNQPAIVSGHISMQASRVAGDSVTCDAGHFASSHIILTSTITLQYTVNGIVIPIQYVQSSNQWLSDGVGLVRSVEELLQGQNPLASDGRRSAEESVLTRFSIR